MSASETKPPDRRDADAQEIADRMTPFVAKEGFGAEWKLFGPALVKEHIETAVEEAQKRLDAAFADLSREQDKADGWMTVHHSLATGNTMTTDAPGQDENRIVLDTSCERSRLATYRGVCRMLGDIKQTMLAAADEVTITAAPLGGHSWILKNGPHPAGRRVGLRIVIILPLADLDGGNHYSDVHKVAHLAVVKAWLAAGKSTLVWLSGLHYSEIYDLAKEIENPRGALQVVQTGPGKLLSAIHHDGVAGAFRKSCHVVFSPAWEPGKHPAVHSRPFHREMAETLAMLLGMSRNVSIKETYGPAEIDPGFGATIFAKGEAAEYWRAVMDTWRRGGFKPAYLPVTLDDYSELAKGALPYRTADWLYSSDRAGEGHPRLDEPLEAGGGHG